MTTTFTESQCKTLMGQKTDEAKLLREKMNALLKQARSCQRDIAKIDATLSVYREILASLQNSEKA